MIKNFRLALNVHLYFQMTVKLNKISYCELFYWSFMQSSLKEDNLKNEKKQKCFRHDLNNFNPKK